MRRSAACDGRNDDYYQGKPGVKEVVRLNFPNEQSALAALQAGDIDSASLREAGNVKAAEETEGLSVQRYDSNWIFAGRYNMANEILADKAVREAISYAVDRENLVKAAVSPTASAGNSPISIGWAASPDVTVFDYDSEKAKTILEEAGWTGDGIREKDGQKLSLTVTLYPDYAAPDLAAGMQQLLQQVGIELNINQLEYAAFETEVYQNQNFDMYIDWQGFGVDPDITSRWITNTADTGSYLDNPSNYSNPEVDAALTASSTALDPGRAPAVSLGGAEPDHRRRSGHLAAALGSADRARRCHRRLRDPGHNGRHGQHRYLPRTVEADLDAQLAANRLTVFDVANSVGATPCGCPCWPDQ